MHAFYDEKIPNIVSKYIKKWGAKVGKQRLKQTTTGLRSGYYSQLRIKLSDNVDSKYMVQERLTENGAVLDIS
jgi:hypothetical protein